MRIAVFGVHGVDRQVDLLLKRWTRGIPLWPTRAIRRSWASRTIG